MAKKKVSTLVKKRVVRKKKVPANTPIMISVSVPAPIPACVHEEVSPPYPLPTSCPSVPTDTPPVNPADSDVCLSNIKTLWKSKNFWAAVCLFLLSGLTIIGSLPALASNPIVMGITGMAFAVLWIVFRMTTNQPVTPTVNLPHPAEWFRKKP